MQTLGKKHPEWQLREEYEDPTPHQAVCIEISAKIDRIINECNEEGRGEFCSVEDGEGEIYTVFQGWINANGHYGEPMNFYPYSTPTPALYMRVMRAFREGSIKEEEPKKALKSARK